MGDGMLGLAVDARQYSLTSNEPFVHGLLCWRFSSRRYQASLRFDDRRPLSSLLALARTILVPGLARLSTQQLCFRLCKISAAAPDPDLPEMHSEQIEMDDPIVPPGASAMRTPGGQTGRGFLRGGLLLP